MGWIIFDFAFLVFDVVFLIANIMQGSLLAILFAVCAVVMFAVLITHIRMYRRGRL